MKIRKNKMRKWIIACGCILGSTLIAGTLVPCLTSQGGGDSQPTIATPTLTAAGDNNHDFGTGQILLNGAQSTLPTLGVGYLEQNYIITNTVPSLPDNTIVTYGITSSDASYFSIVNGVNATLTLGTGLPAGSYNFTMSCVLQHSGYNTSTFYSYFTLSVVANNPFPSTPTPTYNGADTMASQVFDEGTSNTYAYVLDIPSSELPNGTTVTFSKPTVGATYYTINSVTNTLTVTNNENSHPLYAGNYTLPIQITLACPGYVQKTYTVNAIFTVTPKTTPTQTFNVTDALTALYTINAGTALYYQGTTSAVWGNQFIDLYQYALNNGADITQEITFHITGNLTSGLLIDPRLKDVVIDNPAAQSITPAITGTNDQNACGILLASATSNAITTAGYTGSLVMNSANLTLTMNYNSTKPDWYGIAYGFNAGIIGSGANINIGFVTNIQTPHNNAYGINFNNTINGTASITIDTRYLQVRTKGYTAAGAVTNAYGISFSNIAGTSSSALATINVSSTVASSVVYATGECNGIIFNGTINNANITFAANTTIKAYNVYRGAVYALRFNGIINGTQDAKTTINIDGTYYADSTASGYVLLAGNTTAIYVAAAMNSWSTSNKTTFAINKNATLSSTANNIAYGVFVAGVIGQKSTVDLNGNIRVISTLSGVTNSAGIQLTTIYGTVNIGALLYVYYNSPKNNTIINGIYITGSIQLTGIVTFSGVMSVIAVNSINNYYSTIYGVRVAASVDNGSTLAVTGIINLVNGDPSITSTASGVCFGVYVATSSGQVRVIGTSARPVCINLEHPASATAGNYGTSIPISIMTGDPTSSLTTNYLYVNTFAKISSANATFLNATTDRFYRGSLSIGVDTRVYSANTFVGYNANVCLNTYAVYWNETAITAGNNSVATQTSTASANLLKPLFLNASSTNTTGMPTASTNFSLAINPYTGNRTDYTLYYNYYLQTAFVNWYNAQSYSSSSTAYSWCYNMVNAVATSAGWNAHS